MINVNDLIKIIKLDNEDMERFIEIGQGGIVTEVCDQGVRITWAIVLGVTPDNDAIDDYFLYYDQICLA